MDFRLISGFRKKDPYIFIPEFTSKGRIMPILYT